MGPGRARLGRVKPPAVQLNQGLFEVARLGLPRADADLATSNKPLDSKERFHATN